MKDVNAQYAGTKPATARASTAWRVAPLKPVAEARGPFRRLLRRQEPNTFQRCLAVHLYFATTPRSALS